MVLGLGGASLPPRHKRAAATGSGAAAAGGGTAQLAGGGAAGMESSALPQVRSSSGLAALHAAQVGAGAAQNGAEGAVETPTVDTPVQELAASDQSCWVAARATAGASQLGAGQQQQPQGQVQQEQQQQVQQPQAQTQSELVAAALGAADLPATGGLAARLPAQASQQAVASVPGSGFAPAADASSAGGRKRSRPGSQETEQQQQQQRPTKAPPQGGPSLPARPSRPATSRGPSPAAAEEQLPPPGAAALPSSSRKRGASTCEEGAESAGGAAEGWAAPPAKRARGGARGGSRGGRSPGGGRGRGRGGRGGSRVSKYADVLHRMVQVPGAVFFDTKSFLGRVTKAEGRRSEPSVEVLFVDDPQRYWFPVAEVRQWMADMVDQGTWERFNPGVPAPDFKSILAATAADAGAGAGAAAGRRGRGGGTAAAAGQQAEEAAEEAAKTLQSLSTSLAGCPAGSTGAQPAVSSRPRRGDGASSLQVGPSGDASCHLQRSGSEVKRVGALDIMAVAADLNGTAASP